MPDPSQPSAPPVPSVAAPPMPSGTMPLPAPMKQQVPLHFTNVPPPAMLATDAAWASTAPPHSTRSDYNTRAGLPVKPRLVAMAGMGAFWGFGIGAFMGGRHSALQYLAENAHRLPTTVQGWYFYHKTKNYRVMLGGIQRGTRYAAKTGGLCLLYGAIEAALDDVRGEADVVNSITAGMTTAALFSTATRLSRSSARYSLMFGALFGLATGGLADLHNYISKQPPRYLQWLSSSSTSSD